MRPSQGFWGTGEKGYLFLGNRETKATFLREQGNKDNIGGTGNIRKQIFDFFGTGEQTNFFQGNKGKVPPWEGLVHVNDLVLRAGFGF